MKNMFFFKKFRSLANHYLVITALVAIIFATVYNLAFWGHVAQIYRDNPEIPWHFKVLTPIAISLLMMVIFILLFSYRYILKVAFILLCLITSVVSYMAVNYKVIFDVDMMENVMQTNVHEATSYFSWSLVAFVVFLGVIPAIAVYKLKISYATIEIPRF